MFFQGRGGGQCDRLPSVFASVKAPLGVVELSHRLLAMTEQILRVDALLAVFTSGKASALMQAWWRLIARLWRQSVLPGLLKPPAHRLWARRFASGLAQQMSVAGLGIPAAELDGFAHAHIDRVEPQSCRDGQPRARLGLGDVKVFGAVFMRPNVRKLHLDEVRSSLAGHQGQKQHARRPWRLVGLRPCVRQSPLGKG